MKTHIATILIAIGILLVFNSGPIGAQQCESKFNLSSFRSQGTPISDWEIIDSVTVMNTAYVYPATFYVSNFKLINVLIQGTLSVQSGGDNDFIGVVFGYHQPTTLADDNNYRYYLFDWKAEEETSFYRAQEGFRLTKYDGFITLNEQKKYMWGTADDPPKRDLLKTKYGDDLGWEPFVKYDFELLYTSNRIRITIDGETIFEMDGCFNAGRFGFYCMSQNNTRFENFTYKSVLDFVPEPVAACEQEKINFTSFDYACSQLPGFVESVLWEFGDGFTSNEVNSSHIYEKAGDYPVSLIMTRNDGCRDTLIKNVIIKSLPLVNLGEDRYVQACSSVTLDAGTDASEYLWSTGEKTQQIELNEIASDTNIL